MATFTSEEVFLDPVINSTCDQMLAAIDKYEQDGYPSDFCLYGKPAKIFQGATLEAVPVICFCTGTYRSFLTVLRKFREEIRVDNQTAYADRVQLIVGGKRFEVVKLPKIAAVAMVNGLPCYDYTTGAQDNQQPDPAPQPGEEGYEPLM